MSSDQFERKLQERFAQAEIQPSAALWDRIEADLSPPKSKRRFLWLLWPLAGLLFLSVGLAWVWQPTDQITGSQELSVIPAEQPSEQPVTEDLQDKTVQQLSSSEGSETEPATSTGSSIVEQENMLPASDRSPSQHSPTRISDLTSPEITEQPLENHVESPSSVEPEVLPVGPSIPLWIVNNEVEAKPYQLVHSFTNISPTLISTDWPSAFSNKWTIDLSLKSGYAVGLFSPIRIGEEQSLAADYAGLANRSSYSGIPSGQVATVLFPRFHHMVSAELGRMVGHRWRFSVGFEGKVGLTGKTGLGEIDPSYATPPGGGSGFGDPVIVVEESRVNFSEPKVFDHYTLSVPLRVNYLLPVGKGKMEYSAGVSLNRSWTHVASQSQVESFAFQLNSEARDNSESLSVPDPVLQSNNWHSDLRLRGRYVFHSRKSVQPFIGAELQTQTIPAFSGDASTNQRPFLVGLELGIRFR